MPHGGRRTRSIPARAGEPQRTRLADLIHGVYPRACGGASGTVSASRYCSGLSPRVRGSLGNGFGLTVLLRSIPARAGEPQARWRLVWPVPVYPRACGGAPCRWPTPSSARGLSPRVRGSPLREYPVAVVHRSIPARAGEPGETLHRLEATKGLSPRVRGSPATPWVTAWWRGTTVYPRACGGAGIYQQLPLADTGLSPRVRGSRAGGAAEAAGGGSIPARAGEPPRNSRKPGRCSVYPRACGGAYATIEAHIRAEGLSPRVRGSLHLFGIRHLR